MCLNNLKKIIITINIGESEIWLELCEELNYSFHKTAPECNMDSFNRFHCTPRPNNLSKNCLKI